MQLGTSLTQPRRRVLSLLAASQTPLKAYDLIAKAGPDGGATKPPTVYRALEFLCQIGLVHRIEHDATYTICNHTDHSHRAALFVCQSCKSVTEVPIDALQQTLNTLVEKAGFTLTQAVIEGRGLCRDCLASASPSAQLA